MIDEKRLAEIALHLDPEYGGCDDGVELLAMLREAMKERDALAVQNEALRQACKGIAQAWKGAHTRSACATGCYVCMAEDALALDLLRAARIAEARNTICDLLLRPSVSNEQDNKECGELDAAIVELRKCES